MDDIIRRALEEDLNDVGDVTTLATVSPDLCCRATFLAKDSGVIAGFEPATKVFSALDERVLVHWHVDEGKHVVPGTIIGTVQGPVRPILTGERLALNILQRMSGIATFTFKMVEKIRKIDRRVVLLDSRKTAPGLRVLDKMAVTIGGGRNHRHGLYDSVMVKDNHIRAAGGIAPAVAAVRRYVQSHKNVKQDIEIVVEARTLDEVREVLQVEGVTRILLDNMVAWDPDTKTTDTSMLDRALTMIAGRLPTEASGNVSLNVIEDIAKTGIFL